MNLLKELNLKDNFDNILIVVLIVFLVKEGDEDIITILPLALLLVS